MRKYIILISLVLVAVTSYGQWLGDEDYLLNFDDTSTLHHLKIDTLTNISNLWQVGTPQKSIFTNSYSIPNVIVTDTVNPYPTNDTSSFIIENVVTGYGWILNHTASIEGYYFVNSDTLSDYGMIEFSPNNGISWYDIVNDTTITNQIFVPQGWLTLSGNSNGWLFFQVNLAQLGMFFNIQMNDTVLFRFTFISDSIQTNKDGLMFDDLHFLDYFEGISEIQNNNLISISPNPTKDELRIHSSIVSNNKSIQILNSIGQVITNYSNFDEETIDIRNFKNGIYLLKYSDGQNLSTKRFVVQH